MNVGQGQLRSIILSHWPRAEAMHRPICEVDARDVIQKKLQAKMVDSGIKRERDDY